jgi:hypothetical protein
METSAAPAASKETSAAPAASLDLNLGDALIALARRTIGIETPEP